MVWTPPLDPISWYGMGPVGMGYPIPFRSLVPEIIFLNNSIVEVRD